MSDRLALLERAQQGDDDACRQMLTEIHCFFPAFVLH